MNKILAASFLVLFIGICVFSVINKIVKTFFNPKEETHILTPFAQKFLYFENVYSYKESTKKITPKTLILHRNKSTNEIKVYEKFSKVIK